MFGTEDQKKTYLPKLASGEWLGCFSLTRPAPERSGPHPGHGRARRGRLRPQWHQELHDQRRFRRRHHRFFQHDREKGQGISAILVAKETPVRSGNTRTSSDPLLQHHRDGLHRLPGPAKNCWGRKTRIEHRPGDTRLRTDRHRRAGRRYRRSRPRRGGQVRQGEGQFGKPLANSKPCSSPWPTWPSTSRWPKPCSTGRLDERLGRKKFTKESR